MYYFLGLSLGRWEIIYYVAFVILTSLILGIAIKTYLFTTKKTFELLCKCIERGTSDFHSNLFLEIYNHGSVVVKDVNVRVQERSFGSIPFLKPGESYEICLAVLMATADKHRHMDNPAIDSFSDNKLNVWLNNKMFSVDVSVIMNSNPPKYPNINDGLDKISEQLGEIRNFLRKS
ncbi:MAG: hypothetical protein FWE24_01065 [Defluviitaleaceae bacterium]|nr:hypothetical protein [Defluviitaleaceae bacterium]